jgi:putative mRNA 3-end processing factor
VYGLPVAPTAKNKSQQVTWRDGIHLTGTAIWCDARRSRDICFVSVANALPHAKHGQLIASPETLQILGKPGGQGASQLGVPYGQPFTLGTQRIELFASGHALGAASLLVHTSDAKLVYAGAIHPRGTGLGGAIDHRSADVLVLSARYGQSHFLFEDSDELAKRLALRCQEICADGGAAVLLVEGIGKALDTLNLLGESGLPLSAHRSIHEATSTLQKNRVALPALKRWNPKNKSGRVVLWPLAAAGPSCPTDLPTKSSIILVSGRALDPESLGATGASEGFAWSNQADHTELLQYIQSSGAKKVYLTHSVDRGAALADKLPGISVEAIGPPEQLSLF